MSDYPSEVKHTSSSRDYLQIIRQRDSDPSIAVVPYAAPDGLALEFEQGDAALDGDVPNILLEYGIVILAADGVGVVFVGTKVVDEVPGFLLRNESATAFYLIDGAVKLVVQFVIPPLEVVDTIGPDTGDPVGHGGQSHLRGDGVIVDDEQIFIILSLRGKEVGTGTVLVHFMQRIDVSSFFEIMCVVRDSLKDLGEFFGYDVENVPYRTASEYEPYGFQYVENVMEQATPCIFAVSLPELFVEFSDVVVRVLIVIPADHQAVLGCRCLVFSPFPADVVFVGEEPAVPFRDAIIMGDGTVCYVHARFDETGLVRFTVNHGIEPSDASPGLCDTVDDALDVRAVLNGIADQAQ